jgi:hypothetical protein
VHDDTPLRYRTMDDILGDQKELVIVQHDINVELHLTHSRESCAFAQAEGDVAWRAAMQQMDSVEHNWTWELVDLLDAHCPITLKWVFKLKKNEAREVVKHKARLVTHGFVQQEGIDYDDAFAPVARIESICVLALLARRGGASITWT